MDDDLSKFTNDHLDRGVYCMDQSSCDSYSYAQLPHAGLGNKLLVWGRGLVFAHLNHIPFIVAGWRQIKPRTILRNENSWRLYWGYFKDIEPHGFIRKRYILRSYNVINEPPIARMENQDLIRNVYLFNKVPHWSDYFLDLKNYRDLVRNRLYEMVEDKHLRALSLLDEPVIGVHVRMGDFRQLKPDEDFAKVGLVRTPLQYFINTIRRIREAHGSCLPVTIFSNGSVQELQPLLMLPNVHISGRNSDIVDLLLLSKSRLIIPSAGSTFSYWSAFLSDSPIIHHPDHFHGPVRSNETNRLVFEGPVPEGDAVLPGCLLENISKI